MSIIVPNDSDLQQALEIAPAVRRLPKQRNEYANHTT